MESLPLLAVLYSVLMLHPSGQTIPEMSDHQDGTIPSDDHDVVVSVNTGQLKGVRYVLADGHSTMTEFRGIPYARPPTGDLRFAPPRPALDWPDVREATHHGSHCPQPRSGFSLLTNLTGMDEDCLYLNVFSPFPLSDSQLTPPSPPLLPVMVWLHGGAYYTGSGEFYDASPLAAQGQVVVVTLNYRLGVLGYLSTEDDVIPGNFGLLDQVMALKWIRLNIRQFGGDPDQVTVLGYSAGAHSISLLSLSPAASGLFQRAILQGGSSFAPTTISQSSDATSAKEAATQLAAKVGCLQLQDSPQLLACLRSKPWQDVLAANPVLVEDTEDNAVVLWKPRVDGESGVLHEDPTTMFSKGKFADIETMHGFTADELSILVNDGENDGVTLTEVKEGIASLLSPYSLDNRDELIQEIARSFLPRNATSFQRRTKLVEIMSNFQITAPVIREIETLVNVTSSSAEPGRSPKKHFLYRFSYRGSLLPFTPAWQGVPHGLDIPFVFGLPPRTSKLWLVDHDPTPTDLEVAQLVVHLWSNFAKYGDPTPGSTDQTGISWPEYSPEQRLVLDISENSKVQALDWTEYDKAFQLMVQPLLSQTRTIVIEDES